MSGLGPGERIAQRYIVTARLGSGGMATVYRCQDSLQHGALVAVKLLHHHLLVDNPEIVARFRREAETLSVLSAHGGHPNVVRSRDAILRPDVQAIVMELVEGGRGLDALLADRGVLPEAEAVALVTALLAGLAHVHAHGIIHRDLKPSNVLLAHDPVRGTLVPRISDFGIAKWLDRDDASAPLDSSLTQTRSAFGSPAYMAPELFDSAAAASIASDLYAVGVVLYELLVGTPPFVVDSMPSHVLRVSTQAAPSPRLRRPELSGDIERVLAIALAKDPQDRFPSAAAFAAALAGDSRELLARTPAADPERIGRDYRVDRRIGRGPHATVYACTDETLGVTVAVKLLRSTDAAVRERFLAEARAQAPLHQGRAHRSIAAIRHVISEDDVTALVLEHVEGLPLDRYVAEARPDLPTVLRLFAGAADGLSRAHGMGILHRNLKPQNFLVVWNHTAGAAAQRRPRTKLCDFGMDRLGATPTFVAGLAPERVAGQGEPSAASDVYALAVLLVLALEGRLPAVLPAGAEGARQLAASLPEVPSAMKSLLREMLAVAPAERPSMARVFEGLNEALRGLTGEGLVSSAAIDLNEIAAARGDAAAPASPASRLGLVVALAVVALSAGLGIAWFIASRKAEATSTRADTVAAETPAPVPETSPPSETLAPAPEPDDVSNPPYRDVSEDVGRFLSGKAEDVSACLKTAFRHPRAAELESASGELEVEIAVDAEGAVREVRVLNDSLALVELGPCMVERIGGWTFPASGRDETWAKRWHF